MCTECLNEFRKREVIDEIVNNRIFMENTERKMAFHNLLKNTLINMDMMIDKRINTVLGPEADYTCYKEKF